MQELYDQKQLQKLSDIMQNELGLDLSEDELLDAAISIVRITSIKLLHHYSNNIS